MCLYVCYQRVLYRLKYKSVMWCSLVNKDETRARSSHSRPSFTGLKCHSVLSENLQKTKITLNYYLVNSLTETMGCSLTKLWL